MPRGDKSVYTNRQKRKAEHIEEGYEKRGVSKKEAERRAWATVNKEEGGGNKSGSGRGVPDTKVSSRKGGRLGGRAAARRPAAARSACQEGRCDPQAALSAIGALPSAECISGQCKPVSQTRPPAAIRPLSTRSLFANNLQ